MLERLMLSNPTILLNLLIIKISQSFCIQQIIKKQPFLKSYPQMLIKEYFYCKKVDSLIIIIFEMMKQEEQKYMISRKPLRGKNINGKLNRLRKANTSFSPTHHHYNQEERRREQLERNVFPKINEQSISFIAKNQESSFISNGYDRSIDSFDKMLFGVEEVLNLEENSQNDDLNYSFLYKQFQKLCKDEYVQSESTSNNEEEQISKELKEEGEEQQNKNTKQPSWEQQNQNNTLSRILKDRLQEVKELIKQKGNTNMVSSDPNISIRLLGANLSQIHEEQIQNDESIHRMDPIEEQFIDFVNKGHGSSKINISKIEQNGLKEKKVSFKGDTLKQTEQDEVVAMLENELLSRGQPQEESINQQQLSLQKKPKKESFLKENYKHILEELDDNEEKKADSSQLSMLSILAKRTEWIQNRTNKSARWKSKELKILGRFKEILENPYAQFSDEEDQLSL